MKKITGSELLEAIGTLPEQYLTYPSKVRTRSLFFKKITIAASLILCVGIVLTFMINNLDFLFLGAKGDSNSPFDEGMSNGDMESDNNIFAPGGKPSTGAQPDGSDDNDNSNPELDFPETSAPLEQNEIIIDLNGKIINQYYYDYNSLQIPRSSNDIITIIIKAGSAESIQINVYKTVSNSEAEEVFMAPGSENGKLYYSFAITEYTEIDFSGKPLTQDFELCITPKNDVYLIKYEAKNK